jgi:hypothetical protein
MSIRKMVPAPAMGVAKALWVAANWAQLRGPLKAHVSANYNSAEIEDWAFKAFSQHSEAGILCCLVKRLKLNGNFVEFGFGATENNSICLSLNDKMPGIFIDGNNGNIIQMNSMLKSLGISNAKAINSWMTKDNIDQIIVDGVNRAPIDIVSVDVDGVDYWLFKAITTPNPAIFVTEYNASFGSKRAVTVAYRPDYDRMKRTSPLMHGMSLTAATKLANEKGYELVGCNPEGGNAFFVRQDLLGDLKPRLPEVAFRPLKSRLARMTQAEQEAVALSEPLIEV